MAGDIFEEDPFEAVSKLSDDPGNVRPEVPLVVRAAALPGLAERLAWVSCKEGVEGSSKWLCVEGCEVIPDRGRGEVSGALRGDEARSRVFVNFDEASGVESGLCEHEAHIEPASSSTKAKAVLWSGRYTHIMPSHASGQSRATAPLHGVQQRHHRISQSGQDGSSHRHL